MIFPKGVLNKNYPLNKSQCAHLFSCGIVIALVAFVFCLYHIRGDSIMSTVKHSQTTAAAALSHLIRNVLSTKWYFHCAYDIHTTSKTNYYPTIAISPCAAEWMKKTIVVKGIYDPSLSPPPKKNLMQFWVSLYVAHYLIGVQRLSTVISLPQEKTFVPRCLCVFIFISI